MKIIKGIVVVVILMAVLAVLTTVFRVVMPPEEVEEKADEEALIEASDPLKAIGEEPEYWQFPGTTGAMGRVFVERMIVAWFVIFLLAAFAFFARRKVSLDRPSRIQVVTEAIIDFFNDICKDTMGKEEGRKIFPLVMTLFLFMTPIQLLPAWGVVNKKIVTVRPSEAILSDKKRPPYTDLSALLRRAEQR